MRNKNEIRTHLTELKSDERHHYKPALVHINGPLALIQVAIQAKIDALEWALGDRRYKINRGQKRRRGLA